MSSGSRFCRRPEALGFPGLAHFFAPREHIFPGILEVLLDPLALDHVARTSAGYQVGRILLSFMSAWHDEINGYDRRVFEAGLSVQSAVPVAELIAFQNLRRSAWLTGISTLDRVMGLNKMVHLQIGNPSCVFARLRDEEACAINGAQVFEIEDSAA